MNDPDGPRKRAVVVRASRETSGVFGEHRHGALTVIERVHTKDHVQRELQKLDKRLFVERQLTFGQEQVWCVCMDLGERAGGVFTVHEHRDTADVPIGYPTMKMVDEISRMMQRGPVDLKALDRRNKERREERRRHIYGDLREMAAARERSAHPIYSALLPRSRALQISRQNQRAARRELTVQQKAVQAEKARRGWA